MNIRDLEYLVALSEFKHFRRAADSCNVSQPTLSGQIRKLEDELGIILLERTSRKVLFTQSGMLLVDQARTVLREVKLLKEMASNQGKEMTGPLHIGLIPTVGPYLLPYIVPTLKETFPDLEVFLYEAQTHQLLEQLETGRLDCAIVARVPETEAFIEVPIFDEKMFSEMSTEEVEEHLLKLIYYILGTAYEIKIISNTKIKNETPNQNEYLEKKELAEKILAAKVASSINELLSNKQLALDSPQSNQIFNLLGGGIRIEGEYVPVDLNKVYVALNSLPSDRSVENKEFINHEI